jgi:hypothetical protein
MSDVSLSTLASIATNLGASGVVVWAFWLTMTKIGSRLTRIERSIDKLSKSILLDILSRNCSDHIKHQADLFLKETNDEK